jgi:hypothetical protein
MSALGQKRTLTTTRAMSALPPKADMVRHDCYFRFAPTSDGRKVVNRSPHACCERRRAFKAQR